VRSRDRTKRKAERGLSVALLAAGLVSPDETVGVIGSSHSAVLVLMNLLEMQNGPKVVNLYRSPLKYAKFLPDGRIVLDNTGLKVRAS
jgi:hypothetical protein